MSAGLLRAVGTISFTAFAGEPQLLQQRNRRHRRFLAITPEQAITVGFIHLADLVAIARRGRPIDIGRVAFLDNPLQSVFGRCLCERRRRESPSDRGHGYGTQP
jgi:hypothetical protein